VTLVPVANTFQSSKMRGGRLCETKEGAQITCRCSYAKLTVMRLHRTLERQAFRALKFQQGICGGQLVEILHTQRCLCFSSRQSQLFHLSTVCYRKDQQSLRPFHGVRCTPVCPLQKSRDVESFPRRCSASRRAEIFF
jgi:hypothetical protein